VLHPAERKTYIFDLGADHPNRVVTLDEVLPRRWTDQRGPMKWPPRSPDRTSLDYSVKQTTNNDYSAG
jgi:hypothetical protein